MKSWSMEIRKAILGQKKSDFFLSLSFPEIGKTRPYLPYYVRLQLSSSFNCSCFCFCSSSSFMDCSCSCSCDSSSQNCLDVSRLKEGDIVHAPFMLLEICFLNWIIDLQNDKSSPSTSPLSSLSSSSPSAYLSSSSSFLSSSLPSSPSLFHSSHLINTQVLFDAVEYLPGRSISDVLYFLDDCHNGRSQREPLSFASVVQYPSSLLVSPPLFLFISLSLHLFFLETKKAISPNNSPTTDHSNKKNKPKSSN